MNVEIVTKEDLQQFRLQLLGELKALLTPQRQAGDIIWLRSTEVRKLLKISPNTLQNLRVTATLHPSKIGGIYYYKLDEINQLLDKKGSVS